MSETTGTGGSGGSGDVPPIEVPVEVSPRRAEFPPRRTPDIIRAALLAAHISAESNAALDKLRTVLGPYTSFDRCLEACNAWSRDKSLQPRGTFSFRSTTRRPQARSRGELHFMECTQASKLQCKYKLCYEQASDLQ